ncbi:tRNA (adenosine(37)-N6)-threonylcarbamoyltransferase complex transferase subunit TsaD [Candidatus Parcubacteria bacterium]|nr:tRNA (adenosine(37)-N6)-threonylcarbamoyltransferase complex transferase subunit TsaD [Candidatus Parcubacteria bacterium]
MVILKYSINNLFNLVKMLILGIETSCDETAAAVVEGGEAGTQNFVFVRSNIVSSQINIHKKYGGVVPEVAAREHILQILPVVNEALEKAGIKREQAPKTINAIAVTVGPGLITSLLVGVETAKVLSYVWEIPVVAVNHIEGHIYANFINKKRNIEFPALVLTVSGGHTMLVLMKGHGKYKTIGETRDDAAGEAFDKAAKLLGLGYPGGPTISAYAEKFNPVMLCGTKFKIQLPRPMINSKNYDFSFSGLKTALLYKIKKDKNYKKKIPEYCYEFQQAVIDVLIYKTVRAVKEHKVKTIMLTGGVAANKELRAQFEEAVNNKLEKVPSNSTGRQFIMPDLVYTTDNAAMVAVAGYYKAKRKDYIPWQKLRVDCNLEL